MRILFFSHYFPPESNAPAVRTHEHCKRWAAAGHDVTVITCAPNCPSGVVYAGYRNSAYTRETIDGIDVRRVWTYLAANRGTFRRTLNYLSYMVSAWVCSLFVGRRDVIIATSPQFFCGWAGVLAALLRRAPFILEIRDIWPESIEAVGAIRKGPLMRFLGLLERRMYASARHIITVGEGYRSILVRKGVSADRISVIMNGIDPGFFFPRRPSEELARQFDVAGKFVCSYVGTIGMACGLHSVLDAAHKLKERGLTDIVFLLVGDGAAREELEDHARQKNLDNVIFTGRQPRDRIPDLLALSDVCLVHLRKTELFSTVMPSKIFEAAAMARPIINGVAGFAAEFIDRAGGGINIEPENSEQLINALLRLRNDPGLRESLGAAGRAYVLRDFNRDQLAEDYLRIIERVLSDGGNQSQQR